MLQTLLPSPRLRRLVVAALIATVAWLAVAQHAGPADASWIELSRYLPYPVTLSGAVVAVLLSARLGRRWLVASLVSVVVVVTAVMGLEWHVGTGGTGQVRLMTYNVKSQKALQRPGGIAELAREVARQAPAILVMQEADGLLSLPARTASAGPELFGFPHVYAAGQYVIASRYALDNCAQGRLGTGAGEQIYVSCVVSVEGVQLTLITAHFESPRSGLDAARHEGLEGIAAWRRNYQDRLDQSRTLAKDLAPIRGPLILAGDLNAPEASWVVRQLLATGLRDAFSSAGRGWGYSYGHTVWPGLAFLRIDHILVSSELGVADCDVGEGEASDHRPVFADLYFARP